MFLYILIGIVTLFILLTWFRRNRTISGYGDRHVFITGCDTGFGNMLTKRLDELGFNVFAACLSQKGKETLEKETSQRVTVLVMNVTKTETIEKAFEKVKSSLKGKGLWGLVNNAGVGGPIGHSQWLTKQDYLDAFEVNTLGIVETTRVFIPLLVKAKGRIVNITSMMGRIAACPGPYVASKFAAEGYSDWVRREMYHHGVTVHILEPGFFQTNIINRDNINKSIEAKYNNLPKDLQKYFGPSYLEHVKFLAHSTLDRFASPDTHLVIDAYVHALTSKYPKYRYVVGKDANYFFRVLWNLPEWFSDYMMTKNDILPEGAEKD